MKPLLDALVRSLRNSTTNSTAKVFGLTLVTADEHLMHLTEIRVPANS